MPLPQLQTYPGIVTPKPADAMMQAMKMKNELARTGIAKQNADVYKGNLELNKEQNMAIRRFRAYDTAFKNADSEETFKQIVKEQIGEDTKVKFKGPLIEDLEFEGGDGKMYLVTGSKVDVAETVDAISKDPTWFTDPEKAKMTANWLKQRNVIVRPAKDELREFEEKEKIKAKYKKDSGGDYKPTEMERSYQKYIKRNNLTESEYPIEKYKGEQWRGEGDLTEAEQTEYVTLRSDLRSLDKEIKDSENFPGKSEYAKNKRARVVGLKSEKKEIQDRMDELLGKKTIVKAPEPPKEEKADMPSAAEHSGRIVKDTETGKRFKSNGTDWVEIKE